MENINKHRRLTSSETNKLGNLIAKYGIDFILQATFELGSEIIDFGNPDDKKQQPENAREILKYIAKYPKI